MIDSSLSKLIAQTVAKNFDSQVKFLAKLVKTNSVNSFTPETSSLKEPVELEVAEVIYDKLSSLGLGPRKLGASKKRPNVVCNVGPRRFRKSLLFNGHMDTRGVEGEVSKRMLFSGVRNNKMYGLGVFDMKAALSAYIYAAKTLIDLGLPLDGRLTLAFVVDSQPGACSEWGSKYLLSRGVKAKVALIGKPGTHTVAIGHRGGYRFKLSVFGESVHAGLSLWEKGKVGRNAIVDMGEVIRLFQKMDIPYKTARLFPGRKPTFTFPTKIEGGRSVNLVPDFCVAFGDVRLMPGNSDKQVRLMMEEKLSKIKGLKYKIEDLAFVPAVEIDPKEELVLMLSDNAEQVLKEKPKVKGVGPWNDAWMYITRDVPTVCGFGPDGTNDDKGSEWVSLGSLKKVTEIYARVAVDYLGLKGD